MGIKHESQSDPSLGKEIPAGTPVRIIQHAEHAQFGTISYEIRRLWYLHFLMARSGYSELAKLHKKVLDRPVESSNARSLEGADEPDLVFLVYGAGTQMLLNTVLTMQHFCQEIESRLQFKISGNTLSERIREAFDSAEITSVSAAGEGYDALQEIIYRRDAVEHPKLNNVFNSHPNNWDQVPLNWLLTERSLRSFERWFRWFKNAADEWGGHRVNDPMVVTLTVSRGMKSTRQAKKPPKE
ncbi:hypothetical protein [Haloechinothrix salitolerans]|uniref:Uncharacterized protein n=1 Tax=Haloechinothrix salitolerans TaxID=926830 RepID=A0ABW2BVU9_9PSEU